VHWLALSRACRLRLMLKPVKGALGVEGGRWREGWPCEGESDTWPTLWGRRLSGCWWRWEKEAWLWLPEGGRQPICWGDRDRKAGICIGGMLPGMMPTHPWVGGVPQPGAAVYERDGA
jgi:hypothetical protein